MKKLKKKFARATNARRTLAIYGFINQKESEKIGNKIIKAINDKFEAINKEVEYD